MTYVDAESYSLTLFLTTGGSVANQWAQSFKRLHFSGIKDAKLAKHNTTFHKIYYHVI